MDDLGSMQDMPKDFGDHKIGWGKPLNKYSGQSFAQSSVNRRSAKRERSVALYAEQWAT
jgi:hypothetical protein